MTDSAPTILVVCYGNLCRSPMAAGLLRQELGDGWRVASAGIGALEGQPPTENARRTMLEDRDIDISGERSKRLTAEAVRSARHVLTMSTHQAETAAGLAPGCRERIRLLGAFAPGEASTVSADPGGAPAGEVEIPDPIGGSPASYRDCRRRLEAATEAFAAWLRQGADPATGPRSAEEEGWR